MKIKRVSLGTLVTIFMAAVFLKAETSDGYGTCATVKQQLRRQADAAGQAQSSFDGGSAGLSLGEGRTNNCRGTQCIHQDSDPHLGTMPVVPAGGEWSKARPDGGTSQEQELQKTQQALDYYREELNRSRGDVGRTATDLSERQKEIMNTINKLTEQRSRLWREIDQPKQDGRREVQMLNPWVLPKTPDTPGNVDGADAGFSGGHRRPADYDCVRRPGQGGFYNQQVANQASGQTDGGEWPVQTNQAPSSRFDNGCHSHGTGVICCQP
ncbi:MAG: hypothetical protein HYT79_09280 [Elusimicrobia bacterium]|nr:hypothetical protein [Elusimicrobiota bacterium]